MPTPIVQTYDTWGASGNATIALDSKTTTSQPVATRIAGRPSKKVSYHHNPLAENHHFGSSHPMKPWRLTLTNQLVLGYGLQEYMDCYATHAATSEELGDFHADDYLDFLQRVTLENATPSFSSYRGSTLGRIVRSFLGFGISVRCTQARISTRRRSC